MKKLCLLLTLLLATTAVPAWADEVRGRVTTQDGVPVERARVTRVGSEEHVFTDLQGSFALAGCTRPCTLLITHPRFVEQVAELRDGDGDALEVVLPPRNAFSDQLVVSASRGGGDAFSPESVASTMLRVEEKSAPPATLTELVEGVAGVSENGQGGHFQVLSVRGISRHRVRTLLAGARMTSERRAGIATSFLDPLLMGTVDVVRGPASTYYGSGALGGVVQIFPREFTGWSVATGWDSHGDENYQVIGWGDDEGLSLGVARRDAGNGEDASGALLFDGFTQLSATLQKRWKNDRRSWQLLVIPAQGRDIAKPNTQFPERVTIYPEENHLLVKLGMKSAGGLEVDVWAHPNDLRTDTTDVGESFSRLDNETFDFGADAERAWTRGKLHGVWGLDYFGRRGVSSDERLRDLVDGSTERIRALDDAEQDEAAAFGSVRWHLGAATWQAGARYTVQRQSNRGFASSTDDAVSGFLGVVQPLGGGFELTANAGTGLRFPTLSERFFSGTTGRGGVIGNPDLDAERSLSLDLGLRWFSNRAHVAAAVFRQDIDDYIERIEIADDLLTFVNLVSGTIEGIELEGFWQPMERWYVSWNGHLLDGEDDAGAPLADIPADRLTLGLRYSDGPWQSQLEYQYRADKNVFGSGEQAIPEAHLLSSSVRYQLRAGLALQVAARNLLDERYFNSADRRTSLAPGRTASVAVTWTAP